MRQPRFLPTPSIIKLPGTNGIPRDFLQIRFANHRVTSYYFSDDNIRPAKQTHKNNKPETREMVSHAHFTCKMIVDEANILKHSGIIQIFGRQFSPIIHSSSVFLPAYVRIETSYKKKDETKGKKVLNAFYYRNDHMRDSPNNALLRYDVILAVDTNTINGPTGEKISATSVTQLFLQKSTSENGMINTEMKTSREFCIIRNNILNDQEQLGLYFLLIQLKQLFSTEKVGIVIDFDLGKLEDYNDRTIPIYNDSFFLPPNFELIYASCDNGPEYIVNKLMKTTDSYAKIMISERLAILAAVEQHLKK